MSRKIEVIIQSSKLGSASSMTVPSPKNMAAATRQRPDLKFRPPKQKAVILSCKHTVPGGIYCQECADAFLEHARMVFSKAISRPDATKTFFNKAQEQLKKALTEFYLTPHGLAELEREVATHTGNKDFVAAEKTRGLLKHYNELRQVRNQLARDNRQKAERNKIVNSYVEGLFPKKDSAGKWTTAGYELEVLLHAAHRQEKRDISDVDVLQAFIVNTAIRPHHAGVWLVEGENGVTLAGIFRKALDKEFFSVKTVYRPSVTKLEDA